MPRYYNVKCFRLHLQSWYPMWCAVMLFNVATETHYIMDVGTGKFPWRAIGQPCIGLFSLRAILYDLFKHTKFVAQTVAKRRQFYRRHGIQKASCQAPQAAVTQCCIKFRVDHVF